MIQTQVYIRSACEADLEAVQDFLAGLPMDAQYQRFFTGLGAVSPSLVRGLIAVTPCQQVVLALRGLVVIGHAMATVIGGVMELGVVIAEGYRNQGLATRLLRDLVAESVRRGADSLRVDVLCENQLVVDWIRRSLPRTRFERDGHALTGHTPIDGTVISTPAA